MRMPVSKVLALGGICALFAGVGNIAMAQGYDHQNRDDRQVHRGWSDRSYDYRQSGHYGPGNQNARRRLAQLQAVYAHAVANGNYGEAERAHQHAMAIRAELRSQDRDSRRFDDGGQGRRDLY